MSSADPLVPGLPAISLPSVTLPDFIKVEIVWKLAGAALLIVIGLIFLPLVARLARHLFRAHLSAQGSMVLKKIIYYVGFVFVAILALNQLGLKLGAVLGAAGVAGIAIGFAAQTSLSNIISGFFMIAERPFQIGDVIEVDSVTGTVDSIGLISLTLRTFDNRSVRIPNESLVKNKVTNITRYPIRRFNLDVGVAYGEDIDHILGVLKEVAFQNEFCLDEPDPLLKFSGFGDSSLNFFVGAWCVQADFLQLSNTLPRDVKKRFDEEGIEIPFPHRVLAGGKAVEPLPVKIIDNP